MTFASDGTVAGPQSWTAQDMRARADEWTHVLKDAEIQALSAACDGIEQDRELVSLSADDFALGPLEERLSGMRSYLLHGPGVGLIKGIPVAAWSRRKAALAFWGIGLHLGVAVSQNGKGHLLGHVKDLGLDYHHPNNRGYQTSARLPFHTDYADLVGLLCLHTARRGGQSSVTSSVSVYNEMLRREPELARELTRPLYRTRWGEVGSDRPPWVEVPAFNLHSEGVVTSYVRSAVRKAQLMPEVPRISPLQEQAMDVFDALADDDRLRLDMEFEQGDLQLLNNHFVLHSRTEYEDFPEPERKRHLMRLWLACDDGPPFPPAMTESFQGLTRNGRPNGIHVPGVELVTPLEAE